MIRSICVLMLVNVNVSDGEWNECRNKKSKWWEKREKMSGGTEIDFVP